MIIFKEIMKFGFCESLIPAFLLVDRLVISFYVYFNLDTLFNMVD